MATDNTTLNPGATGDTVRDLARQAGAVKTQVVQLDLGGAAANAEVLVTAGKQTMALSMPVVIASDQTAFPITANQPANTVVGPTVFTASDAVVAAPTGDGTILSGASTAGSVISVAVPDGYTAWTALVKNYSAGYVYSEASINSTTGTDGDWVDVKGRRTGTTPGIEAVTYALSANGYYRGNAAGFKWFRLRFVGLGAAFPTVQISLTAAMGATFLNSGLPASASTIGAVGLVDAIGNKAALTTLGELQVAGSGIELTNLLLTQLLIEAKRKNLILSSIAGTWVEDSEISL